MAGEEDRSGDGDGRGSFLPEDLAHGGLDVVSDQSRGKSPRGPGGRVSRRRRLLSLDSSLYRWYNKWGQVISAHTLKASRANPVDAIRNE